MEDLLNIPGFVSLHLTQKCVGDQMKQHPGEAHLTVDDLRDMIGREGERFANKVVHYGTSLRGTKQYWFKERNKLIANTGTAYHLFHSQCC